MQSVYTSRSDLVVLLRRRTPEFYIRNNVSYMKVLLQEVPDCECSNICTVTYCIFCISSSSTFCFFSFFSFISIFIFLALRASADSPIAAATGLPSAFTLKIQFGIIKYKGFLLTNILQAFLSPLLRTSYRRSVRNRTHLKIHEW